MLRHHDLNTRREAAGESAVMRRVCDFVESHIHRHGKLFLFVGFIKQGSIMSRVYETPFSEEISSVNFSEICQVV